MEGQDRRFLVTTRLKMLTIALLTVKAEARSFRVTNSVGQPCILLDIDFTIHLRAMQNNRIPETVLLTQDDVSKVGGMCDQPKMRLQMSTGANWTHTFNLRPDGGATLNRIINFVPSNIFHGAGHKNTKLFLNETGNTDLQNSSLSYRCNAPQTVTYISKKSTNITYDAVVVIFDIHAQAFNVVNGSFSPAVECNDDKVLPAPIGPPNLHPASGNRYTVPEASRTCISLESELKIKIKYQLNTTSPETHTITAKVPQNDEAGGNCNFTPSSQSLIIVFFQGWLLRLVFSTKTTTSTVAASEKSYWISNVTLTYVVNHLFPNSKLKPGTKITEVSKSENPNFPQKSAGKEYYKCASEVNLKLNDNVVVSTKNLKFKAFNEDFNEDFTGSADVCSTDNDSENKDFAFVALGIVCVTAGLAFIIALVKCAQKPTGYTRIQGTNSAADEVGGQNQVQRNDSIVCDIEHYESKHPQDRAADQDQQQWLDNAAHATEPKRPYSRTLE